MVKIFLKIATVHLHLCVCARVCYTGTTIWGQPAGVRALLLGLPCLAASAFTLRSILTVTIIIFQFLMFPLLMKTTARCCLRVTLQQRAPKWPITEHKKHLLVALGRKVLFIQKLCVLLHLLQCVSQVCFNSTIYEMDVSWECEVL
jgi:hypothetical protein